MKAIECFAASKEMHARALRVIPLGTQTFSKAAMSYPESYPLYADRGEGPYLIDVDGNRYVDLTSALGANLLGYGYAKVVNAVERQLKAGATLSLPHRLETEVAELLVADQVAVAVLRDEHAVLVEQRRTHAQPTGHLKRLRVER